MTERTVDQIDCMQCDYICIAESANMPNLLKVPDKFIEISGLTNKFENSRKITTIFPLTH